MKRFLWPVRVNSAIAGFGVQSTSIDRDLRTNVQRFGSDAALSSHETALVSLALAYGARIGLAGSSSDNEIGRILAALRQDGKIDFDKPEIIDALDCMGYAIEETPRWEHEAMEYHRGKLRGEPGHPYVKTPIAQLFARKRWRAIMDAVESRK